MNTRTNEMHEFNGDKVTLVYQGEFGFAYNVVQARLHAHGTGPYAQYNSAVKVIFTPKGKRKKLQMIQHYMPNLVILKDWVEMDVPDMWGETTVRPNGIVVRTARASLFGATWDNDAETAVNKAVESGAEILVDYRGHNTSARCA